MTTDEHISNQLYAWVEEALELRFGKDTQDRKLRVPDYEEGPGAFVNVLLQARQRADRIETLLSNAKRVRSRLQAKKRDAADAYQDKLDQSLAEGSALRQEYSLGIERKAEANLKSFAEKRAERSAESLLAVAEEVVVTISDVHWGLNGWRADIRDVIRSFNLESNLER